MKTFLKIPTILGKCHLGCSPQERKNAQAVELQIEIAFKKQPQAMSTDSVLNTPCYAEMTELVLQVFRQKHFATIEHLCLSCHKELRGYLIKKKSKGSLLTTTLKKKSPPVKAITGGSIFIIEQTV